MDIPFSSTDVHLLLHTRIMSDLNKHSFSKIGYVAETSCAFSNMRRLIEFRNLQTLRVVTIRPPELFRI